MNELRYAEKQPTVFWLDAVLKNSSSLGSGGIDVLRRQERMGRRITIRGEENIPDGGVIVGANHFVRMKDRKRALGKHKMEDLLASVGAITQGVRNRRGPDVHVIWTPTSVPRPEAKLKRKATAREKLKWLTDLGPSMGVSNATRTLFLKLFKDAPDVMPIPSTREDMKRFYDDIQKRLSTGEVLGFFPEGDVSHELKPGKMGIARISIKSGVPVVPVSQFDRNGELVVTFGKPLYPPSDMTGISKYLNDIMYAISAGLPPELQGHYRIGGDAQT